MQELEDNFVDGSLAIPAHIEETSERSEVECPQENLDVADNTSKTTRKRRASSEKEPRVALGTVDVNAPKRKSGKRKGSLGKEEQPPTRTILAYAEHDKSKEASNVAVVFKHVLMVADTVTRVEQRMKDAHERVEERLKVILADVQRLSKQLEQHITRCEQAREDHSHRLFQSSCGDSLLPSSSCGDSLLPSQPAAMISMDASSIHPSVLAEALPQSLSQSPWITATHCSMPKPIGPVSAKYQELAAEEIDRAGLKSIPEVLQKYPDLQTESKIGILAVKLAREALFGDKTLKRCTPRGWQDIPALPQAELNLLKTALWNQFPRYWSCPEEFERRWVVAQDAVAQACKRLRHK